MIDKHKILRNTRILENGIAIRNLTFSDTKLITYALNKFVIPIYDLNYHNFRLRLDIKKSDNSDRNTLTINVIQVKHDIKFFQIIFDRNKHKKLENTYLETIMHENITRKDEYIKNLPKYFNIS